MARGRFVSNDVIVDKEVSDLSSDTCRLAYIFLITLADREGRVAGDPAYLKSLLFPRRYDIMPDDIQEFILEWIEAGFVIWYECSNGEKALQLVNFEKHQRGLRKDREAESRFEDPSYCLILAGEFVKSSKELNDKINTNNNGNVNLNGKSGVGYGVTPELVGSNFDSSERSDLLIAFEAVTKIYQPAEMIEPKGFMLWEKEINKWEGMGVTKADIEAAVEKADELKTNLSWPGSITKYMESAIARRKRGVNGDKSQSADTDRAKLLEEVWND